jgi:hypothetical protein
MIYPHPPSISLTALFCFFFASSFACKCIPEKSVKASADGSTAIFTGIVLKIEYLGLSDTINPDSLAVARSLPHGNTKNYLDTPMVLKATMLVTNEFKGVLKNDTIVVFTGIRGATCGYKFEPNKEYTVYATNDNYMYMFFHVDQKRFKNFGKKNIYWTNICSRTTIAVGQEQGLLNDYFKRK